MLFRSIAVLVVLGIGGLLGIGTVAEAHSVPVAPNGWGAVWTGMGAGIWLYIGIEYICPMAEEVINPQKNVPRAMIAGVITIFVADMLFGEAMLRYVPSLDMLTSSDVPQLVAAESMYGTVGVVLVSIATVFAGGSSADSHMAGVPRMLYGLARDGLLPGIFAYLHPKFRTPWVAIFATFALMMIPFIIGVDISKLMDMVNMACTAWLVSYLMIQVDVIILRKKYPDLHRPFKSPLYPVPQIISIIMILYAIWGMGTEIMLKTLPFEIAFILYAVIWVKFKMKEPFFQHVPQIGRAHV